MARIPWEPRLFSVNSRGTTSQVYRNLRRNERAMRRFPVRGRWAMAGAATAFGAGIYEYERRRSTARNGLTTQNKGIYLR